jgi:hypothetical protein
MVIKPVLPIVPGLIAMLLPVLADLVAAILPVLSNLAPIPRRQLTGVLPAGKLVAQGVTPLFGSPGRELADPRPLVTQTRQPTLAIADAVGKAPTDRSRTDGRQGRNAGTT